ncbi:MAG: hypothetical protein WCV81_01665 [Microgenomates group bacterium]|jgi:hypothetical protein
MKQLNNIFLVVISFIILMPVIIGLNIRSTQDPIQPSFAGTEKIFQSVLVSQKFLSKENGLSGIGISIKNPNLANKNELTLSLYEGERAIRSLSINGGAIEDGSLLRFLFPKIPDSKGKVYTFVLNSPASVEPEAFEAYLTNEKFSDESLIVNNNERQDNVSFIRIYKSGNPIAVLGEIFSGVFVKLFNDLIFSVFYITLVLSCVVYLILDIFKSDRKSY